MPLITENVYVVISPLPSFSVMNNGHERLYFKIGTHNQWDGSSPDYLRCNPNVWYRSFRIQWTGTDEYGQDDDVYGADGPKQILTRMFTQKGAAAQAVYLQVYTHANTEWWYTDDAQCIQALRDLQNGWDHNWQAGAVVPDLNPNNNIQAIVDNNHNQLMLIPIGNVTVAQIAGVNPTKGPVFSHRFGAVAYFREHVGIHSNTL
ncbi:hypothetical protein B0H67DRAFT_642706 [Lasiosphaeris hirsuta]|uniref:Uncharacterized protein n=1 Tax=Lasiosphaeris hirsuta TaxID=260670 RepID=A0AA40E1M2_9PEZI|nr:hypothetical protein B0H67DRAFT_642706 [Lasiosphaeris hirsuta]